MNTKENLVRTLANASVSDLRNEYEYRGECYQEAESRQERLEIMAEIDVIKAIGVYLYGWNWYATDPPHSADPPANMDECDPYAEHRMDAADNGH